MSDGGLTYAGALGVLERALTFGIHPSLDGIRALTTEMGAPQESYRSIQVTGTNGKTSVTRLVSAILHAHGLRVGTYTSPHLISYTERMEVDGTPIAEAAFAAAIERSLAAAGSGVEEYTEFELLTAAALAAFEAAHVHWAVLEVGMGGRWDATSVVLPAVSVVTGVALDHTERLGTTREAIAADKAHIIKAGSVAVIGPGCEGVEDEFTRRAASLGAPVVRVGPAGADVTWTLASRPDRPGGFTRLDVRGALADYRDLAVRAPSYQAPNVAVAIAAAEAGIGSPLDVVALRDALEAITFPGRFECLAEEPSVVIDGAHNPDAAAVLADATREAFGEAMPVFVLGAMADKDVAGIVAALVPVAAGFICTQSCSERALPAAALADVVHAAGGAVLAVEPVVATALASALALAPAGIVCAGSIYVAGEVRAALRREGSVT